MSIVAILKVDGPHPSPPQQINKILLRCRSELGVATGVRIGGGMSSRIREDALVGQTRVDTCQACQGSVARDEHSRRLTSSTGLAWQRSPRCSAWPAESGVCERPRHEEMQILLEPGVEMLTGRQAQTSKRWIWPSDCSLTYFEWKHQAMNLTMRARIVAELSCYGIRYRLQPQ
ncbi:unnamed protein product [Protopolystoma xenopodis]|uniref:Uncharacterized protein n=1 Tax=Protopolystoma xenopodis TaxID=117903 RepID=A0A3S5BSH2_9PLAT|nr:unnamed protein product [Protopolystoma xenopodis]